MQADGENAVVCPCTPQLLIDGDHSYPVVNLDIGPPGDTSKFTLQAADYMAWSPNPDLDLDRRT
jgi:hypothetical protein